MNEKRKPNRVGKKYVHRVVIDLEKKLQVFRKDDDLARVKSRIKKYNFAKK